MPTWKIRLRANIDDEVEVEADTEDEALENAGRDWQFVEASSWESEVIDYPEGYDEFGDEEPNPYHGTYSEE